MTNYFFMPQNMWKEEWFAKLQEAGGEGYKWRESTRKKVIKTWCTEEEEASTQLWMDSTMVSEENFRDSLCNILPITGCRIRHNPFPGWML